MALEAEAEVADSGAGVEVVVVLEVVVVFGAALRAAPPPEEAGAEKCLPLTRHNL